MKSMRKILFLICLFSLSFYSCSIRNSLAPKRGELDAERTFTAQVLKSGESIGYFNIPSKLLKTTEHLAIYLQDGGSVALYALNKMAQEFDYYYDSMTNIYGGHSDIDGNGKIIILLMKVNQEGSIGSTLAYFNPNDMYSGNNGEILYLDYNKIGNEIDKAIGTLIHEFQHLINYSQYLSGKRGLMSSWLNEALSESTSVLFNKATVESRIKEFNGINYYCFYTWNVPDSAKGKSSFINYPSASVFMHWLYYTNGSNESVFRDIAQSTEPADWNKVLTAARKVSGLIGSSWADLLLTWMSDVASGKVKTDTTNAITNTTNGNVNLYPGAMVIYDKTYTSSGNGNIVTKQINGSSKTGDTTTIVLNKDTSLNTNSSVSVRVNGTSSSGNSLARQSIIENKEETRYINILLDENGNIQ